MSADGNKKVIEELFAATDRDRNMTALDAAAASSYRAYFPGMPQTDREGTKAFGNSFYQACPDLRHVIEELIGEGDSVALRMTVKGTHTQPLQGPAGAIPPQGRSFAFPVMNMYRFEGGKIAEHRAVFDMMDFLRQIGAMP